MNIFMFWGPTGANFGWNFSKVRVKTWRKHSQNSRIIFVLIRSQINRGGKRNYEKPQKFYKIIRSETLENDHISGKPSRVPKNISPF